MFKTQEKIMSKVNLIDIRWNRDRKNSFCEGYREKSKSLSQKKQKSARDFEKKISQTYNIEILLQ